MAVDKNGKQLPKGITQRADGRYMGRFTYSGERYTLYDDSNSKRLRKSMDNMLYELEHGLYGEGDKMTLDKWFAIWLKEYKEPKIKESTIQGYELQYNLHAKKKLGKLKLKEIKTIQIQKIYNEMISKGMKVGTVKNLNIVLSNMFKFAAYNGYILKNPCTGIVWAKEEKKEPRALTVKEQEIFLKAAAGNSYEMLYHLAFATGLRVGELCGLTWDDIDFINNLISVNKTLLYMKDKKCGRHEFKYQSPKTANSIRKVPLLTNTVKALRKYKMNQNTKIMDLSDKWQPIAGFENLVFTSHFGAPIQETFVRKRIHCLVEKINREEKTQAEKEHREPIFIEPFSPHTMRHTFATRAFESGMDVRVVQDIMGHGSLVMTNRYTHVLEEKRKNEMEKIGQFINIS